MRLSPFTPSLGLRQGEDHKAFLWLLRQENSVPIPDTGEKAQDLQVPSWCTPEYLLWTTWKISHNKTLWFNIHCTKTKTWTMVSFSFKLTLSSYRRESICSSIRQRCKVVPNAHLLLVAPTHRRVERWGEALKPVIIQGVGGEPNIMLKLHCNSPSMLLVYTVVFPNHTSKTSFTSETKWYSCSPKNP